MEKIRRSLDRLITVSREDLETVKIIRGQSLTDVIKALGLRHGKVTNLSEKYPELRPRRLSEQDPLVQVARPLGLDITVTFYDVGGLIVYFIEEPPIDPLALKVFAYLRQKTGEYGAEKPGEIVKIARDSFDALGIPPRLALADRSVKSAIYYVFRDVTGYGPLEIAMEDPFVEEVSWFAYDEPVEVVDKKVSDVFPNTEFIVTNVFLDPDLDDLHKKFYMTQVVRLVTARGGTGLTVARPLAEARIPDPTGRGFHRLAAHLDVVSRSPAVTIRKFPHVKLSLPRLVGYGTVSPLLAAYLVWLLLNRGFLLIVGIM